MSSAHYETSTRHRQPRYSAHSDQSMGSTQIRSSGSVSSGSANSVNYLAGHLQKTASFDYNKNRNSYYSDKENDTCVEHEYGNEKARDIRNSRSSRNSRNSTTELADRDRVSLENNYSRAMSQMNRGDYGPVRQKQKKPSQTSSKSRDAVPTRRNRNAMTSDRRVSQSTATTLVSSTSTSKPVSIQVNKRSVSKKDPSEETIAIFGAYGVTGQYFLRQAIEAGYKVKAMVLPGMEMQDASSIRSLKLITGTFNEIEKIREVVKNATYVVCLLNDCDHGNFNPPVGNDEDGSYQFNNLNFMHNLVPILEDSDKCRVLLYEASSLAKGNKGTPVLSTLLKKMAVKKEWRAKKKEQDQIVKYVMHQTKNAHFNYIITRPGGSIWDKPSRKKLAASKSQPGPFPITNTDLAEFTLSALKLDKVYNSCPFVVQDGF